MKRVRLFLASSIKEFQHERIELGAFIQKLNESLIHKGIYADLEVCEEFSNAVSFQGKQKDYNDRIRQCDVFCVLFGKKIGQHTMEEYETAYDQYKKTGKPQIKVFFDGEKEPEVTEELLKRFNDDGVRTVYFHDREQLRQEIEETLSLADIEEEETSLQIVTILAALSLKEAEEDKADLLDYIRSINDTYMDNGLFFDLRFCENSQSAIFEELRRQIDNSSFFYVIIGNQSEQTVIDSFEYAYNRFLRENKPRIYTYFQVLPEGTAVSEEVRSFMKRLGREISHYYSRFSSLDSIKLNMLLELTRNNQLRDTVDIKDGKALVNGKELMSLQNIPVFRNNEELDKYKDEINKLREEKTRLAVMFAADPENMDVYDQLSKTASRYQQLQKEYHDTEKAILDLFSSIAERNSSGETITWRERKASEYLDEGDYNAALTVLRDPEREEELQRAYEKAQQIDDEFTGYVNEGRLKIKTLQSQGITKENLPEIYDEYERIIKVIKDRMIKSEAVSEYVSFLRRQCDFARAIENAEWLEKYYALGGVPSVKAQFDLENILGILYSEMKRYDSSERHYLKALEFAQKMCDEGDPSGQDNLAATSNNLGNLYSDRNRLTEAEECLKKAIEIKEERIQQNLAYRDNDLALYYNNYGTLCQKINKYAEAEEYLKKSIEIFEILVTRNPSRHESDLAQSYNNLAMLYYQSNRLIEAEEYFLKALEIREREAADNPAAYEDSLSTANNNLALLYQKLNRFQDAESRFLKAIEIDERLVQKNPAAYEGLLALNYNNIGLLYADYGLYDKALPYYQKAVSTRERLAEEDAGAFQVELADAYNQLGNYYSDTGNVNEAERYLLKALQIRQKAAGENPSAYQGDVAQSYNNLGFLYSSCHRYDEAVKYHEMALEIRERLAEANPSRYREDLALTCNNLAYAYENVGRNEEAEEYSLKAIRIREELAAENPSAYQRNLRISLNNLAMFYSDNKRYEEAEEYHLKASGIAERMAEENPSLYEAALATDYHNLGNVYYSMNQLEKARDCYSKAIKIREKLIKTDIRKYSGDLASTYNNQGVLFLYGNNPDVAEKYLSRAVTIYEWYQSETRDYDARLSGSYGSLAAACARKNDDAKAEEYYRKAVMIRQQLASENPSFRSPLAYGYRYLGDVCKKQGKVEEAEKYYALARETDPGVMG